jgi:hypothetical protein
MSTREKSLIYLAAAAFTFIAPILGTVVGFIIGLLLT